jgi:hypothetical protein
MRRAMWGRPKRRLKKDDKPPVWTTKDRVTFGLALFGALLSTVLAYNTLLVVDDVRVEFDHQFTVNYSKERVSFPNSMNVVVINSGNRPAAIRHARLAVGSNCRGAFLNAAIEPFVLKEKEIVLRELKFTKEIMNEVEDMTMTDERISYRLVQPNKPTEIAACIAFEISTPSLPSVGGLGVPVHKIASVTVGLPNETRYKVAEGPALVLIRHSRFSLWND